jgi:transmembrane 9 superfamily member 2/4
MLVTYMLFFGYMGVICLGMFMLCGSIGFYSCLWFTRKIYASIKVD